MNKIGSPAYTIKCGKSPRTINCSRIVYAKFLSFNPLESVQNGLNELKKVFPDDTDLFTIQKTRIKKGDTVMPIECKDGSWMWA